jgi:uncharacterized protein (DUF927 family)
MTSGSGGAGSGEGEPKRTRRTPQAAPPAKGTPDKAPIAAKPNGAKPNGVRPNGKHGLIRAAVTGAAPAIGVPFVMPFGFELRPDGLYRLPGPDKAPFRICGHFQILGETRSQHGDGWGLLLKWRDRDSRDHEWIMPRRMLAGEAAEVRQRFADCGLDVSGSEGARRALVQFFSEVNVSARVRTVPQTGWYRPAEGGAAFVLPAQTVGNVVGEVVRIDIDPLPAVYRARGTLPEWQHEVAARCAGNSRAVFAVACAFAAPLLPLVGDEGGGFNFRGESSKGKTTLIDIAASVWGAPSKTGADSFVRQWRSTANALEATAAAHNHVLLPMDELGQADPREVPETLYMLANGAGKDRARAGGGNRRTTTWLTLVLSSSEESAARLAEGAGRRIKAGQEVRLLDVPAVVPGAHGCFEELHGTPDGKSFAQALRRAAISQHGTAGPAFVEQLATRLMREPDFVADAVVRRVVGWCRAHVPAGADGQVQRAAQRFGVVAVAGELATEGAITEWDTGAAAAAVGAIFRAWLDARGSAGSREDQHLFAAFRRFLAEHGASRFEVLHDPKESDEGAQIAPPLPDGPRTILRAGWRWQEATEEGERRWVYGIVPEVFDREIAQPLGMEGREARARLGRAALIQGKVQSGKLRWAIKGQRVPGVGQPRLIVTTPAATEGDTVE